VPPLFHSDEPTLLRRALRLADDLPEFHGDPIRIHTIPGLRDLRGPVHAASFLRERRIAFDCTVAEFPRILVHELYHFVWLRCGNRLRWSYEDLVRAELHDHSRGELGWSAEWRKVDLETPDVRRRTRRWREYVCESFCDTAAWLHSGIGRHSEFTLSQRCRKSRRRWFEGELERRGLSI
jgi:hypothetical protein